MEGFKSNDNLSQDGQKGRPASYKVSGISGAKLVRAGEMVSRQCLGRGVDLRTARPELLSQLLPGGTLSR